MTIAIDARIRPGAGAVRPAAFGIQRTPQTKSVTVLTARGRLVLALLVVCAIAVGAVLLGSTVAATQDAGVAEVATVVVQPGDSLWAIASEANPGGDIRRTIGEIVRLNSLESGSSLPAGLSLSVPVYE